MKKVKWIALALVLCLGLIGGAYAYWQETLIVDGTVDTANFDVELTHDYRESELGVSTIEFFGSSDHSVSFYINNLFPQADLPDGTDCSDSGSEPNYIWVEVTLQNNSSIPVKVESIEAFSGDDWVNDHLNIKRGMNQTDTSIVGLNAHLQVLEGAILEPKDDPDGGDSHTIGAYIWLGQDAEKSGYENGVFEIVFEIVQWNKPTP